MKNNRRKLRTCEVCEAIYRPTYSGQHTCGRTCGVELRRREYGTAGKWLAAHGPASKIYIRNCDECGTLFVSRYAGRKRCSDTCSDAANTRNIIANITRRYRTDPAFRDRVITAAQNRRADKLGIEQITTTAELTAYLMSRDRGRCGICRKPVRARTGPMKPSIDHILPLSAGGKHELSNVQLVHYRCNLSKNNRGSGEQLLLVG